MGTLDQGQSIVEALTAKGVSATTDPAGAVPPCVLVPPPVRRYDLGRGYTLVWTLYALAPGQGGQESWAGLDDLLDVVQDVVDISEARPTFYRLSPDAPEAIPAYAITTEEASYA